MIPTCLVVRITLEAESFLRMKTMRTMRIVLPITIKTIVKLTFVQEFKPIILKNSGGPEIWLPHTDSKSVHFPLSLSKHVQNPSSNHLSEMEELS